MKRAMVLALATLTLVACKNVPDVQTVPVPAVGSVLHGRYSGTLTEQIQLVDARLSRDGASVFALFASAGHAIMLDLDPANGTLRKRRAVAAESPQALGIAPDGTLIVAALSRSLRVSPTSLGVVGVLPGAFQISADGSRLVGPAPDSDLQDRYRRWNTSTGAELPTIHTDWASTGLTQDLEWGGADGKTLVNLSSGSQVTVGPLPRACNSYVDTARRPLKFGASADGFYLLEDDATVHRLDASGRVAESAQLLDGCNTYSAVYSPMVVQDGTLRLVFGVYGKSGTLQLKLLTWVPGQQPAISPLGTGSPLPGSASAPGDPLYSAAYDGSDLEHLSSGQRWTVPLTPAQLAVSGEFLATYGNDSSYSIKGSVTVGGQTYDASGAGSAGDTTSPRLAFTQALCAVDGRSFVAPCPRMDWHLNLNLQGALAGRLTGDGLLPSGGRRHSQSGGAALTTFNEDSLNDGRAFQFSLFPN